VAATVRHDERDGNPLVRALLGTARLMGRKPDGLPARVAVQLLMRSPLPELVCVNADGHRVLVDASDQMEANALMGRYRLPPEVIELVRPGDWVIDAGANVGIISSQLCAAVGPAGLVSAWEPIERNIERLRFLKEENGLEQLAVMPYAAGAEDATVPIGVGREGRSGWSSITASWTSERKVEVALRRLDSFPEADGRPLRLVKIDVEGYEFEVLEGCRGLLERHRPWVYCEFNDVVLRDRGRSSQELLDLLADLGYGSTEPTPDFGARAENLLLGPVGAPVAS
jgi:FkbM family methyltransferase